MSVETSAGTTGTYTTTGTYNTTASGAAASDDAGASKAAGEAVQQTKAVASDAKQHATKMVHETRDELRQQFEQRGQQIASSLQGFAGQLRSLRSGQPDQAGSLQHYLVDAEQKVSSWATRLEQGGPELVLRELRQTARRKPGMFLLGALGAGFVAGRMVRVGIAAAHDESGSNGAQRSLVSMPGPYDPAMAAPSADPSMATTLTADAPMTNAMPGDVTTPAGSSGAFA